MEVDALTDNAISKTDLECGKGDSGTERSQYSRNAIDECDIVMVNIGDGDKASHAESASKVAELEEMQPIDQLSRTDAEIVGLTGDEDMEVDINDSTCKVSSERNT